MVNVVGLGYIGLPTALMMASHGVEVVGTDYDADRIARLQRGEIVFEEEGLADLFHAALDSGIRFSADYQQADIYIVAVPTPYDKSSKKLDASYVVAAVKNVLQVAPKGAVIVVESTISPGTIDRYVKPVIREQGFELGVDIHIAHAPERIIPGNMIYELKHNSRTIGADEPAVGERIRTVYASFCEGEIVLTDIKTAEMSKVVENTFRDINIAFANELAKICRSDNMDVYEIIKVANKHPRVNILWPGCGVGGHCIAVDPYFITADFPAESKLIASAREINNYKSFWCAEKVQRTMLQFELDHHRKPKVAMMGLAFKPNIDDLRESPAKYIITKVMQSCNNADIMVVEPNITSHNVFKLTDYQEAYDRADIVVMLVAHDPFKTLPWRDDKIILDFCGIYRK